MGGSAASSAARSSPPWRDALSSAKPEHPAPHSPRAEAAALPPARPHCRPPAGAAGTRSSGLARRQTREDGATFEPPLRDAGELRGRAPARGAQAPEVGSCWLLAQDAARCGCLGRQRDGCLGPPGASWSRFLFLARLHPGALGLRVMSASQQLQSQSLSESRAPAPRGRNQLIQQAQF